MRIENAIKNDDKLSFEEFRKEVLKDYNTAVTSRECSVLGRREVLTGKAKFGIFGGGKEIPQLAMAKAFKKGDFRSGYYRDQTFMMALGELTPRQFFAGLYAHPDLAAEPMSAGRQMGGHFSTQSIDEKGDFKNLLTQYNSSSDISPTAGQMPRMLGIAQASKLYREELNIKQTLFSDNGNEISWGTIGNASTSEGMFFETINAAGVLQVPMIISVWDDDYGISVPSKYQTTKENISLILSGFQRDKKAKGFEILTVKGWDYRALILVYQKAATIAREEHVPVLIHVQELTQPQGHSTSGSHERYKSKKRLEWEKEYDCNLQMRNWILNFSIEDANGETLKIATEKELSEIEKNAKQLVSETRRTAWNAYQVPIRKTKNNLVSLLTKVAEKKKDNQHIVNIKNQLQAMNDVERSTILSFGKQALINLKEDNFSEKEELQQFVRTYKSQEQPKYSSLLYCEDKKSAVQTTPVPPIYEKTQEEVDGRVVLNKNFDTLLNRHSNLFVFGEDSGTIGGVNQSLSGLQEKYGENRVADTGIRETTIIGQAIGLALRGLRPIAEIQYLDYMLYGLQPLSDDLATLHYRTAGKQKAPVIIRTRGHRLEGIWHSGSPMGMLIHALRGMLILVPRNMTQAAGFYNALLDSDDPALIVESLNGYRLKEKLPKNLGEFKTPIGKIEVLKEGTDITVVSYGSTLRIVESVSERLSKQDIHIEIIDVQSLLPFDIKGEVAKSLQKTNRLLVVDEDVPGGASAYLLQEILEKQKAFQYLDSSPVTLTAKPHRPAYGTDGDYFSKPNADDIFEAAYSIMNEVNPNKYKSLF